MKFEKHKNPQLPGNFLVVNNATGYLMVAYFDGKEWFNLHTGGFIHIDAWAYAEGLQ